jgi:adenylate cyclase
VLAVFPCACAAVRWAAVCHAAASRYGDAVGCAGLRLRIGVHRGPVLAYGTRLFGRTVHTACRLQQAAKPGETLISAEVSELIAIHGLANVTDVGAIPLRNVATPVQVYRVDRVAPSLGMGPALAAAD